MSIARVMMVAAVCVAAPVSASALQEAPVPGGAAACAAPQRHQFDFWIGEWDVHTPEGALAGTNRIEPILGGCALQESWSGAGGFRGTSLNTYDPVRGGWHQTWIATQGPVLQLDGGLQDGRMVLSGELPSEEDRTRAVLHRVTWDPLEGGRVRQHWESSEDGGATWKTVFDGMYSRRVAD